MFYYKCRLRFFHTNGKMIKFSVLTLFNTLFCLIILINKLKIMIKLEKHLIVFLENVERYL